MRRLLAVLAGLLPSVLGGAFFLLAFGKVVDPAAPAGALLVVGGLSGTVIVGLVRLFRIAPFGYPFAGLLCGPLPFFLILRGTSEGPQDEGSRAGVWLASALLGAILGVLEWARVRRASRPAAGD